MDAGPTRINAEPPAHLDLDRARGLTIRWRNGRESFYPVEHLRRLSPSAETRTLREALAKNPLTVLPARPALQGPLTATNAEFVGNYAHRIQFSDGHATGLFTWEYLRSIDPSAPPSERLAP